MTRRVAFILAGVAALGVLLAGCGETTGSGASEPPEATISSPSNESTFHFADQTHGELRVEVDVAGSGSDPEDGALTGTSLTWSYRYVDEGGDWTAALAGSSGTLEFPLNHVSPYAEVEVRLTATDSDGRRDSETITIHVYGVQG